MEDTLKRFFSLETEGMLKNIFFFNLSKFSLRLFYNIFDFKIVLKIMNYKY